MSKKKVFEPNVTMTPNTILDYWMSRLSNAEFKCLMAIVRKTFGWQKHSDRISYSQISDLAGINRRNTIIAVAKLIKLGLVVMLVQSNYESCLFGLNIHVPESEKVSLTSVASDTPNPALPVSLATPTKQKLLTKLRTNKQEIVVCSSKSDEEIRKALEPFKSNSTHIKICKERNPEEISRAVTGALQYIENLKSQGVPYNAAAILTKFLRDKSSANITKQDLEKEKELEKKRLADRAEEIRLEGIRICDRMAGKFRFDFGIVARKDRFEIIYAKGKTDPVSFTDENAISKLKKFVKEYFPGENI